MNPLEKTYRMMTIEELQREIDAWLQVVDAPKEPGCPSRAAREAAEQQIGLAEAWIHRKRRAAT